VFKSFVSFYIPSVLLPHTEPSMLPHVCLVIILLCIRLQ